MINKLFHSFILLSLFLASSIKAAETSRKVASEAVPVQSLLENCKKPVLEYCSNNLSAINENRIYKLHMKSLKQDAFFPMLRCLDSKGEQKNVIWINGISNVAELQSLFWLFKEMNSKLILDAKVCSGGSDTIGDTERGF